MSDLVVVGQDPGFGGGALAQLEAFLAAARSLGRTPELLHVPHPTLSGGGSPLDRVEPVRLLRGSGRLVPQVRAARSVWVVATLAAHGLAARRSGRPYDCWVGTSLAAENAGRERGLAASRRLALYANEPALRALERSVLRGARRLYATTPSSRDEVAAAAGLPTGLVGILPIPVDPVRFTPEPDEAWLRRLERPLVAFVGRGGDPRKNLPLALEALPLLRRRVPGATLRVVGPEPPARREGLEPLGEVPDVAVALREAALLLLPSRQEGFAIVAAEALACGVPVLATPCGGPEHLLEASGGGRVLPGFGAEELAAAAAELLSDPERLLGMRRAGREYVAREHSPARLRELLAGAFEEEEPDV